MDIIATLNEYIRSELLIITPVLYVIAKAITMSSSIEDKYIPWILIVVSVVLAGLYTFSVTDTSSFHQILMAAFSTIVQGILLSGTAVFGGILGKMIQERKTKN